MARGPSPRPTLAVARETPAPGVGLLTLAGDVDLATAPVLETEAERELSAVDHLVLDLADVAFLDSTGIALVLDLQERLADRGGALYIANPSGAVRRVFEVLRLDRLEVVPAVEDAVSRARRGRP